LLRSKALADVKSPALWGTQVRLAELFAGHHVRSSSQIFNSNAGRGPCAALMSPSIADATPGGTFFAG
jgi:hypothetical protein